jgi:plasmid stabilization system protein ParE
MVKYRVDISEPAENDLRDIVGHIATQLSVPMTALTMMQAMEKAIAGLACMPKSRPPVLDDRLRAAGYRKLIVKNYLVFFTIDEDKKIVNVERILFARRDWLSLIGS